MDAETRTYLDARFGEVDRRFEEGMDRFGRIEDKLDENNRVIGQHEAAITAIRDRVEKVAENGHRVANAAQGLVSAVERLEQREEQRDAKQQSQHQENLRRTIKAERLAQEVSVRLNAAASAATTKPAAPAAGALGLDTPVTPRYIMWLWGAILTGVSVTTWWITYNAQHTPPHP